MKGLRGIFLLGAVLAAAFVISGCSRKVGLDVVLVLDGKYEFRVSHFADYIYYNTHPDVLNEDWNEQTRMGLFQNYVDEQILLMAVWENLDAARKEKGGWTQPADIPYPAAAGLREEFLQREILDTITIGEEEKMAYYEAHADEFQSAERAIVRYMRFPDKESLNNTLRSLSNREASFAELSVRYATSHAETQTHAYERGTLPEDMESAIFSLREGEISKPVRMKDEFYLFEMVRLDPRRRMTLEEAAPSIERQMLEQKAGERLKNLVEEKRRQYRVETYPEHLNYRSPKGRQS